MWNMGMVLRYVDFLSSAYFTALHLCDVLFLQEDSANTSTQRVHQVITTKHLNPNATDKESIITNNDRQAIQKEIQSN